MDRDFKALMRDNLLAFSMKAFKAMNSGAFGGETGARRRTQDKASHRQPSSPSLQDMDRFGVLVGVDLGA